MGERKWTRLLLVLVLTGALLLIAAISQRHPHQFENQCQICHLGSTNPSLLLGDPDRLCAQCHRDRTIRSHPTGFVPERPLPENFPVFEGRMACVTCHFAHPRMGNPGSEAFAAEMNPYMLRFEEPGKRFCFSCHAADSSAFLSHRHGTVLGIAHLKSADPSVLELLDQSSRECLACHDGTISANVEVGGASWSHARGIGLSHPVGVMYEDSVRKRPREYYASSGLPDALRLVNGRVECITCHDHFSKEKGLLVMDNSGSRMCLSCHNL